jgi:hypothetical protein
VTGFRGRLIWFFLFVVLGAESAPAAAAIAISDDVLQAFLDSGKWSSSAPSDTGGELLDKAFAARLINEYRAAPTDRQKIGQLGLIVLATSVGE